MKAQILHRLHKEWVMLVCKFGEVNYAEDIVQETYIKILTSGAIDRAVVNGEINKAFMYVVLRNNVIDYQRSKGKIYKVELDERLPYEHTDIERHYALDIIDREIQEEINSWHWYDRDLFKHYMSSNKSQREIAKGSKISLSSISNTIVTCKNRIRERVGEDIEDIYNKEYNFVIMDKITQEYLDSLDKRTNVYKEAKRQFEAQTEIKGLGDVVEKITEATGIKKLVKWIAGEDCGCDARKEKLNELFPTSKKPKCLLENEYEWLRNWFNEPRYKVRSHEQRELLEIYNRVFSQKHTMSSCYQCVRAKVHELEKVYKAYKIELQEA